MTTDPTNTLNPYPRTTEALDRADLKIKGREDLRYQANSEELEDECMKLEADFWNLRRALVVAKHQLDPHFIRSVGTCKECGGMTPSGTLKMCRKCAMDIINAALGT